MCDGDTDLALAGGQTLGEVLLLPAEEALLLLGHHLDLPDLAPPGPGLGARPLGPGPPAQHRHRPRDHVCVVLVRPHTADTDNLSESDASVTNCAIPVHVFIKDCYFLVVVPASWNKYSIFLHHESRGLEESLHYCVH